MQTLLDAGATLIGKTITDEVSLGILGENAFDGTPVNVRARRAACRAARRRARPRPSPPGICDTALGTDTGGSVRVPASFCGLYGIRPTHGRIDVTGMLPQAPTSDTTGWFARDAATFARVSAVMLGEAIPTALPTRLIVAVDAFGFADAGRGRALQPMVSGSAACWATSARRSWRRPASRSGRGRSARCSPMRPTPPSRTGSTQRNPRFAFSVATQPGDGRR